MAIGKILGDIASSLLNTLLTNLGQWLKMKSLEERASRAEALERQKQSIKEAAEVAQREREALELRLQGRYTDATISDDAFVGGGR